MTDALTQRFLDYLDASPSPFHAVKHTADLLAEVGFVRVDESVAAEALPAGTLGYVERGGSLLAFRVGARPPVEAGFRVLCAHTDSPNLRIKPQPLVQGNGYVRLGLEPYGGVLLATWTDRDLGIAGRVVLRDGSVHLLDLRQPLCRIPNIAIHLNRTVNDDGLKLNKQTQLPALFALKQDDVEDPFRALLAEALDCEPADLAAWDLGLYDLTPATLSGHNQEFLHSARLDNLASCHAGLEALLAQCQGDLPDSTAVIALFDHEEIGSTTSRGARSRLLESVLQRLAGGGHMDLDRAIQHSWLISADMAHAVHPAWSDRHDPEHMPHMNKGPVIKQNVNANYTTEADTAALFIRLCEQVEAPYQWFVNRSDLGCGSTVGPMVSANLAIRSLDVGNPMLSMHSAREMCGSEDQGHMVRVLTAFLAS